MSDPLADPSHTGGPVRVAVSLGPVSVDAARAWLTQARISVGTIRQPGVVDVPERVLAGFEELLEAWSRAAEEAAASGADFLWTAQMDPAWIRVLSSHWASIAAAARSGDDVLRRPDEEARPFYEAIMTAVVTALADADDGFSDTFARALPAFDTSFDSSKVEGPVRVLVVDDTEDIRMLVKVMLANDPRIDVVAEAGDGVEAIEQLQRVEVDAVLLDLMMPRMDGLTALPRLRELSPGARVVVFSAADHREAEAVRAGADAFVVKSATHEAIIQALLGKA